MASQVFTYAKGRIVELADLPLGTDNLLLVLLQNTGLPADNTLRNCQTLAAVFAAGATEATFTNYSRKVLSSGPDIVIANSLVSFNATVTIAAQTWASAGGAVNNTLSKVVVAYRPTSGATDAQCLPLGHSDVSATTGGGSGLQMAAVTFTAS